MSVAAGLRLVELVRDIPGPVFIEGDAEVRVSGVRQDSRAIEPGDIFAVRQGATHSGYAFVDQALRAGATALMVGADVQVEHSPVPLVRVADVESGLAYASEAIYGHPTSFLQVVGITGTNGKTTTAHLVRDAIDGASTSPVCALIGTLGSSYAGHVAPSPHTTPEADELARTLSSVRRAGATHVAMEVSSIALARKRVSAVRFRVAAFTNLTQDHLDFHGSMEAYAAAKWELFTTLKPENVVVNVDDPFGQRIAEHRRGETYRVRVAPATSGDIVPRRIETTAAQTRIVADTPKGSVELVTRLLGQHNVENLMVALGIACALDLNLADAARALSAAQGAPGRLERCDGPGDDIAVVVDYAHTADALARVLETLVRTKGQRSRLVCVFGCGGDRDATKRFPMGEAAGRGADVVVVTSDNPRGESPASIALEVERGVASTLPAKGARDLLSEPGYLVELDRAKAIECAIRIARPSDVVLIAGKGHEKVQVVGAEQRPFDDVVCARAALAQRRQP